MGNLIIMCKLPNVYKTLHIMKKIISLLVAVAISAVALRAELKYFDAVVTEPGQLATVL